MSRTSGIAPASGGRQEMPQIEPLKVRADFLRVAATRRRWAMPGLVLQVAPTPSPARKDDTVRIGYTASRKVGNAVTRNRARRRLRAAVAQTVPDNARAGVDLVVIARAATARRQFADLRRDLETALKKLDVWDRVLPPHYAEPAR